MNFIFDLYGTLIDIWTDEEKEELWEGVALLLGDGEEKADKVRAEYKRLCREHKVSEECEIDLMSVFKKMLSERGIELSAAPYLASEFRRMSTVRLKLFRGVKTMLKSLKNKGSSVYLVSNAQSCFTLDELRSTGLYDLFDGVIISSDVGTKKPFPDIFNIALDRFGISARDSIYVGNDMRDDVLGADGVGMKTVYIETEQSGSYDVVLPSPTYVVKSHGEMSRLLLSLDKAGKK